MGGFLKPTGLDPTWALALGVPPERMLINDYLLGCPVGKKLGSMVRINGL